MATILGKSKYWAEKHLNCARGTNITAPGSLYVALFTTLPAYDGTGGTEVSGNAYVREAVTLAAPSVDTDGASDVSTNSGDVTFPVATPGNWGTIVGVGIYDASTTGNLLYAGALNASDVINVGQQLVIAAGNLAVKEGGKVP